MKKAAAYICFLIGFSLQVQGQQDPMYSMYMFNGLAINPAYAGSREMLSLTLIGRQQWTGWEGAPRTAAFSFHAPTADLRHGGGLVVGADEAGYTSNISVVPCYSFRIPVGSGALALGIQGGFNHYRVRLSDVPTWEQGDPAFSGQNFSRIHLVAGTGIFFNTDHVYAGISVPNFLPNKLYDPGTGQDARKVKHFFGTAGFVLNLGESVKVKPSALLRYVPGTPLSTDLNMAFLLDETVWLGGSWRPGDGFAFIGELIVKKSLRIGYSYDLMRNRMANWSGPTHEIMLGFDLGFEKHNIQSPRLF